MELTDDSEDNFVSLLDLVGRDKVMDFCEVERDRNGSVKCVLDLTSFGPLNLVEQDGGEKKLLLPKRSLTGLAALQSPFNWKSTPAPAGEFHLQDQFMQMAEPAWDNVSCRVSAAYSMAMEGDLPKARCYLVQLYMILLDMPELMPYSDDSLRRYRPALKHVVDAMWVWYWAILYDGFRGLEASKYILHHDLERLVEQITPFASLPEKQKAAILVLRCGTGTPDPIAGSLMSRALAISPEESTFHCMHGWQYQQARMSGGKAGKADLQAELKAFERSVELHRNSDNLRMLAFSYFGLGTREGYKKAKELIKEVLAKWPDRVTVLNSVSVMLLDPSTPLKDLPAGLECLKKAISIVGETLFLNFQIGSAYFLMDRYEDAQKHLEGCRNIMPEADQMLKRISIFIAQEEKEKNRKTRQRLQRQKR